MKPQNIIIFVFGFLMLIEFSFLSGEKVSQVLWQEKIKEKIGYKGIVAKIGDTPIFAESIYPKIIQPLLKMKDIATENDIVNKGKKLFKSELNKVIDIEVLYYYAKIKNLEIPDEEVEKEIKNIIKKIGGMHKFAKYLKKAALSYDDFKKNLKVELLSKKIYYSIFSNENGFFSNNPVDSFVKPEEIKNYFENNKNEFYIPPRIRATWIVKKCYSKEEKKKIIKYFKALMKMIKQGYSFYKLHKLYSDEIQPRTFKAIPLTLFEKELAQRIENLKVKRGFHIIALANKVYLFHIKKFKRGRQLTLQNRKVYEKIYSTLYSNKLSSLLELIRTELKKIVNVKIYINE